MLDGYIKALLDCSWLSSSGGPGTAASLHAHCCTTMSVGVLMQVRLGRRISQRGTTAMRVADLSAA
jgi:hypothetical protein